MKSFNTVYNKKHALAESERRSVIDREHAELIAAVKREYGVNNLSTLSESEQATCRRIISEMWTKENGLNDSGKLYIAEGCAPLNENTSPEQIEKRFKREVKINIDEICKCLASGSECDVLKRIKSELDAQLGKKISVRDAKNWTLEICSKHIASKLSSVKF
jgi:hypothetical protein